MSIASEVFGLSIRGRASRLVFWAAVLACFLIGALVEMGTDWVLFHLPMSEGMDEGLRLVIRGIDVYLFLVNATVGIRRLHDIGRTGWWILFLLGVPLFGWVAHVILGFLESADGDNRYGPHP